MTGGARDAWQKLYSRHGMQYGGTGDISMLSGLLGRDMLVLDAGCGDGKTTQILSEICDVIGCDFSREALISLRSQRDPGRGVELVECELTHLPFESEKFDAVSCVHSISHLSKDERGAAAAEMSRVLKQEGHLFVEVFSTRDLRFGEGQEVEPSSFMRGNGIATHYFGDKEIPDLFMALRTVSTARPARHVTYGTVAGHREMLRVLMQKP